MAKMERKSFDKPEETRSINKGKIDVLKLGDVTAMSGVAIEIVDQERDSQPTGSEIHGHRIANSLKTRRRVSTWPSQACGRPSRSTKPLAKRAS